MKILVATHNPGKIETYKTFFTSQPIEFISLEDVGISDVAPEDFDTLEENSLAKATYYGDRAQVFTLADDAGLFVDALSGRPGVKSNSLGDSDDERMKKLLELMSAVPKEKRGAAFKDVITLYDPRTKKHRFFKGEDRGVILLQPVENVVAGFGYDPVFYSEEKDKAYAEMTHAEKFEVSHRGNALRKLEDFVNSSLKNGKSLVL